MDATPLTLGQEISGYVSQLDHGIRAIEHTLPHLAELALGNRPIDDRRKQERLRQINLFTLQDAIDEYANTVDWKPTTKLDALSTFKRRFGDWLNKPLGSITKADVLRRFKDIKQDVVRKKKARDKFRDENGIKIKTYENEIGFVPHLTQYEYYNKFIQNNDKLKNIKIINPTDNYKNVIESIRKSKYLISSSLHGLILADSFDIPNIMLYEQELNEGTLKFKDYYSSQGRELNYIKNLDEFFNININDYGNKVDLAKLENSFPKNIIKKYTK
jgi:hypothetical protein